MKAKELRIGNYIQIDDLPIEQITLETFATLKEVPATISLFNSIPLTEESLIKLGFIKSREDLFFLRIPEINCEFHYEKHSYRNLICIHSSCGCIIPEISLYVHSIQNLYFALTGKELEIKP